MELESRKVRGARSPQWRSVARHVVAVVTFVAILAPAARSQMTVRGVVVDSTGMWVLARVWPPSPPDSILIGVFHRSTGAM
jgi:hypothetical protein